MSNPSFSNIDRWLFELMEGNLSEEQIAQLESFLIRHPELDIDRDMWELSKVDALDVQYPKSEQLIRRRPIGLFMSLGAVSILGVIAIGTMMHWPNNAGYVAETIQITEVSTIPNSGVSEVQSEKKASNISVTYGAEITKNGLATSVERVNVSQDNTPVVNVPNEQSSHIAYETTNVESMVLGESSIVSIDEEKSSVATHVPSDADSATNVGNNEKQDVQIAENVLIANSGNQMAIAGKGNNSVRTKSTHSHSSYKKTFALKLKQVSRTLSRMLDNPVALKNLKDPHYHVPGLQSTEVNFGAVGTLLTTRVQTMSRMQWAGQTNQQLMNSLSIDGYSYGMRGGLGLQVNHSLYANGGIQSIYSAITYSPKLSISRNVILEPSIRFTMGNKTIDPTKIQSGSTIEMERFNARQFYSAGQTPIGRSLWYRDLGLGLSVNTRWFYASVQGDNLLRHTDNIYSSSLTDIRRSGQHFIATIGTDYESRKENFGASPYILYQQYEQLKEAWLGINLRYRWFSFGGAISSQLDPAVSIGLKFNRFMLAYNADYTQSQVLGKQTLSHQLTIRILTKPSRMGQRLLNL